MIACITTGDETALARQLGIPVGQAVELLLGNQPVPDDLFLKAVDIVVKRHRQQVYDVRAFLDEIRKRYPRD